MKDFNELKEEIKKKAADVADMTMVLAKKASDTTKVVAKITKLTADVASSKDVVKKDYTEIGKIYYQLHKDEAVEEGLQQLFEEIKATEKKIEACQAEIASLKKELKKEDPDIEVDFFVDDAEVDNGIVEEMPKDEVASEEAPAAAETVATDKPSVETDEQIEETEAE